jgi:hypothetical protein
MEDSMKSANRAARGALQPHLHVVDPSPSDASDQRSQLKKGESDNSDGRGEQIQTRTRDSKYVELYRQTFAELVKTAESSDLSDRDNFFHVMRFLQMLGLTSDEVIRHIDYAQENVCRWMNGQRAPHPEVRRYFVDKCIAVLRKDVDSPTPSKFTRQ